MPSVGEDGDIELMTRSGSSEGPPSVHSNPGKRKNKKAPKSGSHVRNAVHAQRLSFQLVSVP